MIRALGAAAFVVAALSACSSSSTPVQLPEQDVARWVMPLDRFMMTDDIAINYAEMLLMGPCMTDAGFAWAVPWSDPYAANRETSSPSGIRVFNLAIAREYGYRSSPPVDPGAAAWTRWAERPVSEAEASQIDVCIELVRSTELPSLPGNAQLGNELAVTAYDAAEQQGAVVDATRAWRECMQDIGIPDLPEAPRFMPTPWMVEELDMRDIRGTPSADEIRLATTDAECRESSGYINAFYQALWDQEAQLVRDNADALLRFEALITENRERVAQIISENAPPAPE